MICSTFSSVRTGLAVGFADPAERDGLAALRGGDWRQVGAGGEFPYEDAQFDIVVIDRSALKRECVREAHRVLRPNGCLVFTVPERNGRQDGYDLPAIYAVVRDGFDILGLRRSPRCRPRCRSGGAASGYSRPGSGTVRPRRHRSDRGRERQ